MFLSAIFADESLTVTGAAAASPGPSSNPIGSLRCDGTVHEKNKSHKNILTDIDLFRGGYLIF
jgi:hypothetical protein